MKIRSGFVSNSSSSSFIVISYDNDMDTLPNIVDGVATIRMTDGEYEFGWQEQIYSDFYSKFNWCYIMATYKDKAEDKSLVNMLIDTIEEALKCKVVIDWNCTGDYDYYIDHGSVTDFNMEMFESKEMLTRFLFDSDSYIHNDNDNH